MPATHEDIPEEEDEDLGGSVDSDFGTVRPRPILPPKLQAGREGSHRRHM
jgi:hypothetical protein